jgi:acyl carrier protein
MSAASLSPEQLQDLVMAAIDEFNAGAPPQPVPRVPTAALFGADGLLDSLGLVHFIVSLEQLLLDRVAVSISLADERAFSQHRSPFRDVPSLVAYLQQRLQEAP